MRSPAMTRIPMAGLGFSPSIAGIQNHLSPFLCEKTQGDLGQCSTELLTVGKRGSDATSLNDFTTRRLPFFV